MLTRGTSINGGQEGLMDSVPAKELAVKNLVTSDYVLDESIALMRFAHSHSKAAELARTTLGSGLVRVL